MLARRPSYRSGANRHRGGRSTASRVHKAGCLSRFGDLANCGDTCFDGDWIPRKHSLAILEWKVHRPGHRNQKVKHERSWLRAYCQWQPSVLAYAIEIDGSRSPTSLICTRFLGSTEDDNWLRLTLNVT